MLQPQVFFLCSIILTLYFALLQPVTAQITAPWEVDALKAIRGSLIDPLGRLNSWNRGDPCTGNWSHVICYNATIKIDGYLHIKELYEHKQSPSRSIACYTFHTNPVAFVMSDVS